MFDENIGYFVGSANAKLAEDLKYQKQTGNVADTAILDVTKLQSFIDHNYDHTRHPHLDFTLVKISCKKEYEDPVTQEDELSMADGLKTINKRTKCSERVLMFTWCFRFLLVLVVGFFVAFTIYRIVEYKTRTRGVDWQMARHHRIEVNDHDNDYYQRHNYNYYRYQHQQRENDGSGGRLIRARNVLRRYDTEWSGENIPAVYELEPLTFFDSNGDGYGDLNGVREKLDHFQSVLRVNCILIKNLNRHFVSNHWTVLDPIGLDEKLGNMKDLRALLNAASDRKLRVILELDLTGLSRARKSNQTFAYTADSSGEMALFDYDNTTLHAQILQVAKFWCGLRSHGLYIGNLENLRHRNSSQFSWFLRSLRETCGLESKYSTKLIGDFSHNETQNNQAFDLLRVKLDPKSISRRRAEYNHYLSPEHRIIWSLEIDTQSPREFHSNKSSSSSLVGFYFILYALPGLVWLKQSDELNYEHVRPEFPRIYRWDDLSPHSGFSNASDTLWWLKDSAGEYQQNTSSSSFSIYETGLDVKMSMQNANSMFHFIRYFNRRVKTRLDDDLAQFRLAKAKPPEHLVAKVPEPFSNSYSAFGGIYLDKLSVYEVGVMKENAAVLRVQRKTKLTSENNKSMRFYRNVLFLVNFGAESVLLEHCFQARLPQGHIIHVLFDSSGSLPEYWRFDESPQVAFFTFKPNSYLALEY